MLLWFGSKIRDWAYLVGDDSCTISITKRLSDALSLYEKSGDEKSKLVDAMELQKILLLSDSSNYIAGC